MNTFRSAAVPAAASATFPATLASAAALLVPLQALADVSAEQPIETNTTGLAVFGVLFVGFCVGILWMMWKGGKKKSDEVPPKG